jgi:hypothetical protein
MTASGLILPGRAPKRVGRTANALLLWRASDLNVQAVTGQVGTFSRAGTSGGVDYKGVGYVAVEDQPAWTMFSGRSALNMTDDDSLFWPILFNPPVIGETMTMLVELDPTWARTGGVTGAPGIATVGGGTGLLADGKAAWDIRRSATAGNITVRAGVGATPTVLDVPVPATGTIQVLTRLVPSSANHSVYAEVAGVTASGGAFSLAGVSWRLLVAELNLSASSTFGEGRYARLAIARGARTLAEMLAL